MKKILLQLLTCLFIFLNSYAQSEFDFRHFNQASNPQLGGNNFKTVGVGKNGHIWAGSQYHGLVKYNPVDCTWLAASTLTNVFISDIKSDQNGNMWISNAGLQFPQGGGSNIAGGISLYPGDNITQTSFYTITNPGGLTSRNARSVWVDKHHAVGATPIVWVAQGTYLSSNVTQAGGFSVGLNPSSLFFTKGYIGLQVTPYVTTANARTPSCLAVGGHLDEVWVFAQANFNTNQILRYRADSGPHAFLGAYDYTNTSVLTNGFRANAIYFDDLQRGWIGLQDGGIIIKSGSVWKKMNASSIFPAGTVVNPNAITSDQRGNVYIGTSNGLVIYRGGAVDSASSYRRVTTVDGLPTNNINGIAEDTFRNRIILAHSSGISFMYYKKKFSASLEWDYSFPQPAIKPVGVSADGVARLLVKIKREDTINGIILNLQRKIHSVQLSIVRNIGGRTTLFGNLLGKLKIASIFNAYSSEANTGTSMEVSRTDSTPTGEFWFWYVAPEDFSNDSLSQEATMSERVDSVKVKVTYDDNTEDSSYIAIKVHRPPLLVGSLISKAFKGVADIFANNLPLIQSNLFTEKAGLSKNPLSGIADIVKGVLGENLDDIDWKSNSITGLLDGLRNKGIASSRVDFVGHGLFGNIGRLIPQLLGDKFYADGAFKFNNYSKGFFNKFISIGTPHNGSVFSSVISRLAGINKLSKGLLSSIMGKFPAEMFPYKLFDNNDSTFSKLSEIMRGVNLDSPLFRLAQTNVKNHLIVSNVEMEPDTNYVPKRRGGFLGGISGVLSTILRDLSGQGIKPQFTQLFSSQVNNIGKMLNGLNLFAGQKSLLDFTKNSDLFSHTISQAAGNFLNAQNVSMFTHIDKDSVTHEGLMGLGAVGKKILNLINTTLSSPAFSDLIPANTDPVPPPIDIKPTEAYFDTTKIVTDDRQINGLRVSNDTTITLSYRVKDTVGLQYIFINFQDSLYTTISKQKNQSVQLKVKRMMAYSGLQQIAAVGVYESLDSIIYHADTIHTFVTPPDSLQGFRVTEDHVDLYDGNPYYPVYEVNIAGEWEPLSSSDTAVKIVIQNPLDLAYDNSRLAFDAIGKGFTRAYFSYKQYKDTVMFDCQAPLSLTAINKTIASGNFNNPAIWSKGRAPGSADSVIISSGHAIDLNASSQIRSIRIDNNGLLTMNQNMQLKLGDAGDGDFMVDNFGTLNITNGTLMVNGRVKLNSGSTFNMTGGNLIIDGNTGSTITSLQDGAYLFEANPTMNSFVFSGGVLQIIDPPIGVLSQALNCPFNFGANTTLMLGNGISHMASNNTNGFGGSLFPPLIGNLILDAGTGTNNRQLTITKPLNVVGTFTVKTGSNVVMKAAVNVSQ